MRQVGADEGMAAGDVKAAARHVVVHAHDAAVGVGLYADQRNAFVAVAAAGKRGAADHRRHRQHAGRGGGQRGNALPLVNRAQALVARLHHGGHRPVGVGRQHALGDFFERSDHHMGL